MLGLAGGGGVSGVEICIIVNSLTHTDVKNGTGLSTPGLPNYFHPSSEYNISL